MTLEQIGTLIAVGAQAAAVLVRLGFVAAQLNRCCADIARLQERLDVYAAKVDRLNGTTGVHHG